MHEKVCPITGDVCPNYFMCGGKRPGSGLCSEMKKFVEGQFIGFGHNPNDIELVRTNPATVIVFEKGNTLPVAKFVGGYIESGFYLESARVFTYEINNLILEPSF
jgi:hypothetical protein